MGWICHTVLTKSISRMSHWCVLNPVCLVSCFRLCAAPMASSHCPCPAGSPWGKLCSRWSRECATQIVWFAAKPASTPTTSPLSSTAPAAWGRATSAQCCSSWPTSHGSLRSPTRTPEWEPCSTPTSSGWSSLSGSTTTKLSCWTPSNASTTGAEEPAPGQPSPTQLSSSSASQSPTNARLWLWLQTDGPTTTSGPLLWPFIAKVTTTHNLKMFTHLYTQEVCYLPKTQLSLVF